MKCNIVMLCCVMALSFASCSPSGEPDQPNKKPGVEKPEPEKPEPEKPEPEKPKQEVVSGLSAKEIVAMMGCGWNLGNTLDTEAADKTQWGNPLTTKTMIDAVAKKGFTSLRVPTTWDYNMSAKAPYTVEATYMIEVERIVKYGLDNNMFVILNTHHDYWVEPAKDKQAEVEKRLVALWKQIATKFKKYDQKLIFEVLNEPRIRKGENEWNGGTAEGREVLNGYYEACVKAIRNTGGNNKDRAIMIASWAAGSNPNAMNGLVLPEDDNLIVSIHSYSPYLFCLAEEGYTTTWGTETDKMQLKNELTNIRNTFKERGYPVVLGEWGSIHHGNLEDRVRHAEFYAATAMELGMPALWWDNGNASHHGIFTRTTGTWNFGKIADAIVKANPKK